MQNFINRELVNGAHIMSLADFDHIPVPAVPFRPWEAGTKISIPNDLVILSQVFGDAQIDERRQIPCLVVEVRFPDGELRWSKLCPMSLVKHIVDAKGCHHYAHGKVTDFVRGFANWADAINALRGKELLITDAVRVEMPVPFRGDMVMRRTFIYGFDFVEQKYALGA